MDDSGIFWLPLDEVQLWGDNPNEGDVGATAVSIETFGYRKTTSIWQDNICKDGNHRIIALRMLKANGFQPRDRDTALRVKGKQWLIRCESIADLSETESNAFGIALNRTARLGFDHDQKMAKLLMQIADQDRDMAEATGYTGDDLDELLKKLKKEKLNEEKENEAPEVDPDKADALAEKWQTKRGQLWGIPSENSPGQMHLLYCESSLGDMPFEGLLNGKKADGVFTSPPYAEQRKSQYGGVPEDKYIDWWSDLQSNVKDVLADYGSFFVNIKPHVTDGERVLYVYELVIAMKKRFGWNFIDELYWSRQGYPGAYNNRFKNDIEPVYHFAQKTDIAFYPDNVLKDFSDNTDTTAKKYDKKRLHAGFKTGGNLATGEKARPSNLVHVPSGATASHDGAYHPAKFPVKLPEFFIQAFSDIGGHWLDPFSGSGSTMIACERTGRIGLGVELLPKFVAVTLERFVMMGLEPRLLESDN